MKISNLRIVLIMVVGLGWVFAMSSCEKEEVSGYDTDHLHGTFVGNHSLEISKLILDGLSNSLPADPVTGEKPDLSKGFNDTLELTVQDGLVKMYSRLLGITVDGVIIGDNTFEVEEVPYNILHLGPLVEAKGASIATSSPIVIPGKEIGTEIDVKLALKVESVGSFSLDNPLTVPTNGQFVKIK